MLGMNLEMIMNTAKNIAFISLLLGFGVLVFVANWNAADACIASGGKWVWVFNSNTCIIR